MEYDPNVYGYVNGKAVYSHDEFIFTSRGFEEITNDTELLKFAEKVTYGWQDSGHKHSFESFYLSDYALSEPYRSLTKKEFARLKELQKTAREELEREEAKYDYHRYEGTPLTEEQILLFLNRRVERAIKQWGEGSYWAQQAEQTRSERLARWRKGEVIVVDSYEYNDSYGNGTGAFAKELNSDGTISTCCYGYLD